MNHSQIVSFLWGVADLIRLLEKIEADIRRVEKEIVEMLGERS